MEKRLTRTENNKMICGVCAGISKYFGIDPTLIRLGFVVLTCFSGAGLLAYLIAAFIIPKEKAVVNAASQDYEDLTQQEAPLEAITDTVKKNVTAAGAVFSRHMDNLSQNFQDAIEKHETQPETTEEPAAEETEYL